MVHSSSFHLPLGVPLVRRHLTISLGYRPALSNIESAWSLWEFLVSPLHLMLEVGQFPASFAFEPSTFLTYHSTSSLVSHTKDTCQRTMSQYSQRLLPLGRS